MKLVIAIIQPERLPYVKEELFKAEVRKMTVSRVKGCGQQMGYESAYRGKIHSVNLLDKIRVGIVVNEDFVEKTIDAIVRGARTGNIGDGKIFVQSLERCIRIRTGEEGSVAVG
jgi:nitrogen regulatory protein P-II 2